MLRYPWSKPIISEADTLAVKEAVKSTWVSGGSEITDFADNLKEFLDSTHVIPVNNGTSALAASFITLNIQPGDEVIVPAFGFMAAANVLLQMSAVPIFADVNDETWCVDAETLDACISPRTRAIVVTHTYGNSSNFDLIAGTNAEKWNIPIVEDAAEALGSKLRGKALGTFGDFGTFSFHATKLITTGEGGAIACHNDEVAEKLRLIISHGLDRSNHYVHSLPGANFRMPNICAALGNSQFSRIQSFIMERREVDSKYRTRVCAMKHANIIDFQKLYTSEIVPWSFPVRLQKFSLEKQRLAATLLLQKGIEVRPGFRTPNLLPYFDSRVNPMCFPNASSLSVRILSLPAYPSINEEDIDYICESLDNVIEEVG